MAFVLAFQSGLFTESTARLAEHTQVYLASSIVGVSASVQPTELNSITAGLTAKELALAQREKSVTDREINAGISNGTFGSQNQTTFILGGMLFIILVLLILNYALDYLRYRNQLLTQSLVSSGQ